MLLSRKRIKKRKIILWLIPQSITSFYTHAGDEFIFEKWKRPCVFSQNCVASISTRTDRNIVVELSSNTACGLHSLIDHDYYIKEHLISIVYNMTTDLIMTNLTETLRRFLPSSLHTPSGRKRRRPTRVEHEQHSESTKASTTLRTVKYRPRCRRVVSTSNARAHGVYTWQTRSRSAGGIRRKPLLSSYAYCV